MEQKNKGKGDNVSGDKIKRQTNMGDKGTYIEQQIVYGEKKINRHLILFA